MLATLSRLFSPRLGTTKNQRDVARYSGAAFGCAAIVGSTIVMTQYRDWVWSVEVSPLAGAQEKQETPAPGDPARYGEVRMPIPLHSLSNNTCTASVFDNKTGAFVAEKSVPCHTPKPAPEKIGGSVARAIGMSDGFKR